MTSSAADPTPTSKTEVGNADRIRITYDDRQSSRRVAVITLDRPPVNAIDSATKDALITAARSLSTERDLAAVIILGSRHFAAGDDIK